MDLIKVSIDRKAIVAASCPLMILQGLDNAIAKQGYVLGQVADGEGSVTGDLKIFEDGDFTGFHLFEGEWFPLIEDNVPLEDML